jgi:hypothetical protein
MQAEQKMTTAERNAWFETLSPRAKRIQLAQDVLEDLDAQRLRAQAGYYFYKSPELEERSNLSPQEALEELAEAGVTCDVCARGALFTTRVRGYDNFRSDETFASLIERPFYSLEALEKEDLDEALLSIFTVVQLDLIENAFEGKNVNETWHQGRETEFQRLGITEDDAEDLYCEAAAIYRYGLGHGLFRYEAGERLQRIMENILANQGVFVIPGYEEGCRKSALVAGEL